MEKTQVDTKCVPQKSLRSPTTPQSHYHIPSPQSRRGRTFTNIQSEGGHDLDMIAPLVKHSGESVAAFFNGVFAMMIGLCTLGASVTFSFVISPMSSTPGNSPLPRRSRYTVEQVQLFLAISFLLFLITLAFASLCSTVLTFFKHHWAEDWDGLHGKTSKKSVQYYAVAVAAIIGGQTIAAFICMCLVVVAFQPVVGWICFGFVCLFGFVILVSILFQFPWPWRSDKVYNIDLAKEKSVTEELA